MTVAARLFRFPAGRRRTVAALTALPLALGAMVAAAGTSQAASGLQPVSFSVSPGPYYTSTPVKADFTLTNPSGNTGSVVAFTIVVPPGVGKVAGAGVTGPGNWREVVLPCGNLSNCSSQVLVFATLPLSTSVLRPANSLIASIAFTTPSSPTSLPFKMIGIGGGSGLVFFTTTDVPTINVISGDAADFTITAAPTTATSSVAGATQAFTLQSQNVNNVNVPYGPGQVRVELGTDDPSATLALGTGAPAQFTPSLNPVSLLTKYAVVPLNLPASSTGSYTLNIRFTRAGPTSITVNDTAKPLVKGTLPFTVLAGPPTSIGLDTITDGSTTPPLPNPVKGKNLVASFHLADQYGNPTTLHGTGVTLSAGGTGSLSSQVVTDTNPGVDPAVLGTVTTTYSQATPPINFQLTLNSSPAALSNIVASPVDGSEASQTLVPGPAGNFSFPPVCSLAPTDPVCSTANLPQGANGQVDLVQQVCTSADVLPPSDVTPGPLPVCAANPTKPVLTLVQGDFTNKGDGNLYTPSAPASMTITCLAAVCHDPDTDSLSDNNTTEEIAEIIAAYPGHAKSSAVSALDPSPAWHTLAACNPPPTQGAEPGSWNIIPDGTIFCSDHSSYLFDLSGNLSFTIYYLIDPRGGP